MKKLPALAQRNTRAAYLVEGFKNSRASLPIWVLFSTHQLHLTLPPALIFFQSPWATTGLCKVATGAWADRFGRVRLYRLAQPLYALTFVPFLVTKNFALLFVVQVLGGFLGALTSGNIQPVIKANYDQEQVPKKFFTHYLSIATT